MEEDAVREAQLLRPSIEPSQTEMSSSVQEFEAVASGTAEKPGKAGGEEAEHSHSGPDPTFYHDGDCTVLVMEMLDERQDAVKNGQTWKDTPYALVKGKIWTVEEQKVFVYAVLGKGDCFYLTIASLCIRHGVMVQRIHFELCCQAHMVKD